MHRLAPTLLLLAVLRLALLLYLFSAISAPDDGCIEDAPVTHGASVDTQARRLKLGSDDDGKDITL